ncbi:MAG: D-glycero-beta-D-manno-heptose 1-phosphate adenylyltransferase [Rhodobacter sp.]|nr:D-glycero-beta-D-manno-heptose 1-phosphate adenylyltransferase [Rhodobacter sp.]
MPDPVPRPVLIIGDAMIDSYKTCDMHRISPEAPVPVLKVRGHFLRLGGAANVAAGIAALGTNCSLLALSGDDAHAVTLGQMLGDAGVRSYIVALGGRTTIVKERVLAMNQQICRIDYEDRFEHQHSADLMQRAALMLAGYDLVVVSDYDKGCTAALQMLMPEAQRRGIRVLIDPKRPDWSLYAGAFLLKPNWSEFVTTARLERLLDGPLTPQDRGRVREIGLNLMERFGLQHLLVTAGVDGYIHVSRDRLSFGSTRAREVYDLSGAGDSFLAAMAAFLAQGTPLDRAIEVGNAAAGLAVGHVGTTIIQRGELLSAISEDDGLDTTGALRQLARQGKRIVFTNGCFDILHCGHLALLKQAKAEGDVLVVGVNSDASVARLKGPTRPINPLSDRMALLAGLKPVDFVLWFDEDTPLALIEAIQPDVLVKGGDYTRETVVGADLVEGRGGRVVIVPTLDGRSTTDVLARARAVVDEHDTMDPP